MCTRADLSYFNQEKYFLFQCGKRKLGKIKIGKSFPTRIRNSCPLRTWFLFGVEIASWIKLEVQVQVGEVLQDLNGEEEMIVAPHLKYKQRWI